MGINCPCGLKNRSFDSCTPTNSCFTTASDNEPQPDAVLLIDPQLGGQVRLSEDDYVEGAPEVVAEVAASSAALDLHNKKQTYRRHGVQESIRFAVGILVRIADV